MSRHIDVIQSRAFLAWVNAHLREHGHEPITDLVMDMASGVALCQLVSAVTGQKVRGYQSKPRTNAHKMANISLALDTVESCGLPADALDPQDVLDMNTKPILQFLWLLIEKYPAASEKDLLQRLSSLAGETVADLTSAWTSGVLLAKMIDKAKDKLINPETLDAANGQKNVGDALYLLETHFKMPHVLDAADVGVDHRSMFVFLPFVADAVSGKSTITSPSDGPRVFSRVSAAAPAAESSPPSSRATATTSYSSPAPVSSPYVPAPVVHSAHVVTYSSPSQMPSRPEPKSAPMTIRSTPLLNFSVSIASRYPGIRFDPVDMDGRSDDSKAPCHQCGGELGPGRCFRFRIPEQGMHFVHSRCFSCSACRKDFTQGFFYVGDNRELFCTPHYMESKGEVCKSCSEPISDFFVAALDAKFHESCFKCHGPCGRVFTEPKFFAGPGELPFCPECFAASQGRVCAVCRKGVPAPIKALGQCFHDHCFRCGQCNKVIEGSFVDRDGRPFHSECLQTVQGSPGGAAPSAASPAGGNRAPPPSFGSPAASRSSQRLSYSTATKPCKGCGKGVAEGKAVTVSGERYHPDCFKCFKCQRPIDGSFFTVSQGFCCPTCEKTLPPEVEGGNVPCAKCGKTLVGSVISALGKEYHKECFGCSVCGKQFSGGFFTMHGKPVCADHNK